MMRQTDVVIENATEKPGSGMASTDLNSIPAKGSKTSQEWWRGAAIYQIYPRSFADSNGDGIGDLPGITAKLDYVASLGVNGIWLSPFFTSPMADFGYDVSDYRNVDPTFGALADFDALIERAHGLGLKVIIDQVYCHTSDKHEWFFESRQSRHNDKNDWYVWANAKEDGTPPNNWLSVFGGPAWTWDCRRRQFYLHHFLKEQPTLNLHNSTVIDALIDVGKFWIERGVDGFRLDALNIGMHNEELKDNPPAGNWDIAERAYDMQNHIHTLSHPKMEKVVQRFSKAFREFGGQSFFTVAEIGGPNPHPVMKSFTRGAENLSSAYCFDFIGSASVTRDYMRYALSQWPNTEDDGYPAWALSNHDCRRVASRWMRGDDRNANARLFALFHACFRGATFIYQGEELGLPQADIPFEQLVDPEGIAHWPESQGRDGARTPMPWHVDQPHAGFSEIEPWLPVNEAHRALAVDAQEGADQSVLTFFRKVLAMRQSSETLRGGDCVVLDAPESVLVVRRVLNGDEWLCVYNISTATTDWPTSHADGFEIILSTNMNETPSTAPDLLPPLAGFVAHKMI